MEPQRPNKISVPCQTHEGERPPAKVAKDSEVQQTTLKVNEIKNDTTSEVSNGASGGEAAAEAHPPVQQTNTSQEDGYRIYRKRWIMLALFVGYSTGNAMQWVQFAIINNIVSNYYGVSTESVNWTSLVYMVTYIIFALPGSWLLNKLGMRYSCLVGAAGTCLGAWIKVVGVHPRRFFLAFIGQTVVAISQAFILHVPPRLASIWFGSSEVSLACAIGVFGNQLGVALGFVLPPWLVQNHQDPEVVARDLRFLFYSTAVYCSVIFALMVAGFRAAPSRPPSRVSANQKPYEADFKESLRKLFRNKDFILLTVAYGLLVGVFYALSTLLNQIILTYYPPLDAYGKLLKSQVKDMFKPMLGDKEEDAGRIGLTMVVTGMFGSISCGYLLDKSRRYKYITLGLYLSTMTSMIIYMFTLDFEILEFVYVVSALLGFFMTGYLPVGFEYAAELTYPEPEGNSSGILNASAQVFGILLTILYGTVLTSYGVFYANVSMVVALAVGSLITAFVSENLRRQRLIRGRRGRRY